MVNNPRVFANLSVRIPPDILEKLHRIKMASGKSLNQLVVEALSEYVEEVQKEA